MPAQSNTLNWILLCVLGLIWGASFLGVEMALTGFGPLTVASIRILLAAILIGAVALAGPGFPDHKTPTGRRIWLHAAGMGMMSNAIPFSLLSWGQVHVTSGFAGISMAVVPLLVLPLAHLFVPGERLSPRKIAGFITGFIGVAVLIGPDNLTGSSLLLAQFACVAASACYACGSIITRLCPKGPLISFSAAALLVASLTLTPLALMLEPWPADIPAGALAGVIYLGVFPTALATILLVRIVQSAGPSFMSMVNYQVPVWATLLGVLVLGEDLPPSFLAALGLILLGLAIAQARIWRFRP